MLNEFLSFIFIPLLVGVLTNVISEWIVRKMRDNGDKK